MDQLPSTIQQFISHNTVATIATISVSNGYPYVLPVFYVLHTDNKLYFSSHKDSRKIKNIEANPHIGISITDITHLQSFELQGTAKLESASSEIINKIIKNSNAESQNSFPPIMKLEQGSMQLISVTIEWYRLADYSTSAPIFTEGTVTTA